MRNWPCGQYSLNTRKVGGLREVVASLEPRGEKAGPCLVFWGLARDDIASHRTGKGHFYYE